MQNRSLVLYIRPENDFYDYDIYIEETEKIKKVREKNLIEMVKQNCRRIVRDKTGKKPFTNINIARL